MGTESGHRASGNPDMHSERYAAEPFAKKDGVSENVVRSLPFSRYCPSTANVVSRSRSRRFAG